MHESARRQAAIEKPGFIKIVDIFEVKFPQNSGKVSAAEVDSNLARVARFSVQLLLHYIAATLLVEEPFEREVEAFWQGQLGFACNFFCFSY